MILINNDTAFISPDKITIFDKNDYKILSNCKKIIFSDFDINEIAFDHYKNYENEENLNDQPNIYNEFKNLHNLNKRVNKFYKNLIVNKNKYNHEITFLPINITEITFGYYLHP